MAAAYSKSKGTAGLSTGDTQSDAEYNALVYCHQLTGAADCQGARWVLNGWLALAEYNTGSASAPVVNDWAISAGHTAAEAHTNAVNFCDQIAGADVCKYIDERQSPSTNQPYTTHAPSVGADDYPTFLATPNKDAVNPDPWDFFNRECVSFVAWRINDNNGVYFSNNMTGPNSKTGHWGFAYQWAQNAVNIGLDQSPGYNTTPTRGSIAWWGKSSTTPDGHVAYVDSVTMNGSQVAGVTIEQYNWNEEGEYSTVYIPVGSTVQPPGFKWAEPYPTGFIHGLEGTKLIT